MLQSLNTPPHSAQPARPADTKLRIVTFRMIAVAVLLAFCALRFIPTRVLELVPQVAPSVNGARGIWAESAVFAVSLGSLGSRESGILPEHRMTSLIWK